MIIKANRSISDAIILAFNENSSSLLKTSYGLSVAAENFVVLKIHNIIEKFKIGKITVLKEKDIWKIGEIKFLKNGKMKDYKNAELLEDFEVICN